MLKIFEVKIMYNGIFIGGGPAGLYGSIIIEYQYKSNGDKS